MWEVKQSPSTKKKKNENKKALELSPVHADVFGNMGVWTQQSEQKEDNVIEDPINPGHTFSHFSYRPVGVHHAHHLESGPLASRKVRRWISVV